MGKRQKFIIPPFDSFNLTAGKRYAVIRGNDEFCDIKDNSGDVICVCTSASIWMYQQPWRIEQ